MTVSRETGELHVDRVPYSPDAPGGVCLACFNRAERLRRPFVVWCPHREHLVEILGRRRLSQLAHRPGGSSRTRRAPARAARLSGWRSSPSSL